MTGQRVRPVQGLVLAGGQSRRFTHGAKALEPLGALPMIAHVLRRLRPQVQALWISSGSRTLDRNRLPADLQDLRCLPDPEPRFRGPLAGLAVGLDALAAARQAPETEDAIAWLQLAPCDAPFLPADLVKRLQAEAGRKATFGPAGECLAVVPRAGDRLQPTFALWHRSAREPVRSALANRGGAGLLDVLRQLPHRVVDWDLDGPGASPPPFFNVNTRDDLDAATDWLQSGIPPDAR